jgi:recombinational DNA repair protein RecT
MSSTDIATRTRDTIAHLFTEQRIQQIQDLLPDTVPVRRFVQAGKMAVGLNPDLAQADQRSLVASVLRCAQDGLLPDGHEAALVTYKGKVSYLPMVAGVITVARDYGWTIRSGVVYEHDSFEVIDEPPIIRHQRAKPGVDRGVIVAAYAIAVNGDQRIQAVLYADEIAKRRAKAQTQNVWNEWPEAMARKSAAHAVCRLLPRSELDRAERLARIGQEEVVIAQAREDPVDALWPPATVSADPEDRDARLGGSGTGGDATGEGSPLAAGDPDPAEWVLVDDDEDEAVAAAAKTPVPSGVYADEGLTFEQVAERRPGWFLSNLKKAPPDHPLRALLETFVRGRLPDQWAAYEAWKAEQPEIGE